MLGENLKSIRTLKRIGIRELSRKSGVKHTIIVNIERGKTLNPGVLTIMKITKALGITIDELVD